MGRRRGDSHAFSDFWGRDWWAIVGGWLKQMQWPTHRHWHCEDLCLTRIRYNTQVPNSSGFKNLRESGLLTQAVVSMRFDGDSRNLDRGSAIDDDVRFHRRTGWISTVYDHDRSLGLRASDRFA